MRALLLAATVAALAAALAGPASARVACGSVRPAVATLQDRPVLVSGHRTTISALVHRRIAGGGATRSQAERLVVAVRARLVKGRTEPDGNDRVVLADPRTGETLTAILPPDSCHRGATRAQGALMDAALESFNEACAPLEYLPWTKLTGFADVTGVVFLPRRGGPVELQPPLRFRLVGGGC